MYSRILKTATYYLLPVLLLFSVFILLRGHYKPGGGFVGGLIASIAFVMHSFANSVEQTLKLLRIPPVKFIPVGLILSLASAVFPMFLGDPIMTGVWYNEPIPIIGMIGTALFFDLGVYLLVIGVVLTILFTISQSTK
ncbi:multisubunit sodium/proton antiporter, MrpB subunit [Pseudopedobacter saltans DSM 12145]|uniref:Multisubunit sodium/proton antiporter, MrpB subunit n=1 Tax=Pseudopedobacter saltans (strain ATCC 51119 / DSM 12145 / JCM 21818 / CCUG 39354 / LMG 10337 / NBRC 100064 / NCIMB 13643) TaxID=762903 RepID=F0SE87_PSESL|nr:Na+/H+ antiporter subunit B [Pseudopedobacter saltans]ADY54009.1 multisubunit sodium/proton antiporter, MrpB subunit [Pseudopedobacter saltans DSM 12145]